MDNHNLFETPTTYNLIRLEYLVFLSISITLLFLHLSEVRIWAFVLLFLYIDLIGYIPGAIAYRLAKNKTIPKFYYILYNSMHSLVSASLIAGLWYLFVRPEWALLAIPIHLFGDRSIFGNFLKPFNVSFEPKTHPAYELLKISYLGSNQTFTHE